MKLRNYTSNINYKFLTKMTGKIIISIQDVNSNLLENNLVISGANFKEVVNSPIYVPGPGFTKGLKFRQFFCLDKF